MGGYYVVYLGWRYEANNQITLRMDSDSYSVDETITLKIPFNLPYQSDQSTYKRAYGDIQHKGEFYKKVKQKIDHDTLYVVCIKDRQEKKAFDFMVDMAKSSTDTHNSSTAKLINTLIKDYVPSTLVETVVSQQSWFYDNKFVEHQSFNVLVTNFPVDAPPPELLS